MKDYKAQTIPDDTERKKRLNEERNPRVTIMGEATQELNPLTGRRYEDSGYWIEQFYFTPRGGGGFLNCEEFLKHQTPDFVEYQLSLARMNVRDGKMRLAEYKATKGRIESLLGRMSGANIPLSLISSADGLDGALSEIEVEERTNEILKYPNKKEFYGGFYGAKTPAPVHKKDYFMGAVRKMRDYNKLK